MNVFSGFWRGGWRWNKSFLENHGTEEDIFPPWSLQEGLPLPSLDDQGGGTFCNLKATSWMGHLPVATCQGWSNRCDYLSGLYSQRFCKSICPSRQARDIVTGQGHILARHKTWRRSWRARDKGVCGCVVFPYVVLASCFLMRLTECWSVFQNEFWRIRKTQTLCRIAGKGNCF